MKKYELKENEIQEIIKLYKDKNTMDYIANQYNVPRHTISNILKKNNIYSKRNINKSIILNNSDLKNIIDLYFNKKYTLQQIGEIYNLNRGIISKFLKDNNIDTKNHSHAAQRYDINEHVFDSLENEKSAYWLGMLFADGSIDKTMVVFGIGLQYSDKNHIKKFQNFLETNKPLKERDITLSNGKTYKSIGLSIKNKYLCKKLVEYGLIPAKSEILSFPNCIPINFLDDFMRGYIDGDGSISKNGKQISFIATPHFIKEFEKIYNVCGYKVMYNKMQSTIYNVKESKYLIEKFYKNKIVYLERKYERAIKNLETPKA